MKRIISLCVLAAFSLCIKTSFAADFDEDGLDDFILIDPADSSELSWFAVDLNDSQPRSLGGFGELGDHLALGSWQSNGKSSRAIINEADGGALSWKVELNSGLQSFDLGTSSEQVISGFDHDKNGSIDPVAVAASGKKLVWKILSNPLQAGGGTLNERTFGAAKASVFFADIDGSGDRLGIAKLNKKKVLTLRFLKPADGSVSSSKVRNFKGGFTGIYPVAGPDGRDYLYAVEKTNGKYKFTIINQGVKVKRVTVLGDEIVVGRFTGEAHEVVAVRNNTSAITVIDLNGSKTVMNIALDGILADEININSFSPTSPIIEPPPVNKPGNPVCSGTADSREHLLYKPVSDTSGNVVLVFDSKYKREFVSVKLELNDGSFTDGWWKGLQLWGNPDAGGPRQHWRTNVRASAVKDNALIIVNDGTQECRFMIPGSSRQRWE